MRFELDAGPARRRIGPVALDGDVATECSFHLIAATGHRRTSPN